jgi:transposase
MLVVSPKHRIFLAIKPLDFRKGMGSLAAVCQQQWQLDPLSGHYFIFRNKKCTNIKILYYDGQGLCLFQKRLSTGRFTWPREVTSLVSLSSAQLAVLVYNGDPKQVTTRPPWQPIQ